MAKLYERFILEYFRFHYAHLNARARQINWNLDEGNDESIIAFLPTMQSRWGDSKTFHSHNMYQIFSYVKNHDVHGSGNVSGMLLYAKTEEDVTPNANFSIGGNRIYVKTLDLNLEFPQICVQLEKLIEKLK